MEPRRIRGEHERARDSRKERQEHSYDILLCKKARTAADRRRSKKGSAYRTSAKIQKSRINGAFSSGSLLGKVGKKLVKSWGTFGEEKTRDIKNTRYCGYIVTICTIYCGINLLDMVRILDLLHHCVYVLTRHLRYVLIPDNRGNESVKITRVVAVCTLAYARASYLQPFFRYIPH